MTSETDPNRNSETDSQGGLPENEENERTENRRTSESILQLVNAREPRRHEPGVYLVAWPDGVVKVGTTERSRYRAFLSRGGHLIAWWPTDDPYTLESATHSVLQTTYPGAFQSAAEAEPHLGGRGGGWAETYRVPSSELSRALDRIADCIDHVAGVLTPTREAQPA